jgi:hypothetical protein
LICSMYDVPFELAGKDSSPVYSLLISQSFSADSGLARVLSRQRKGSFHAYAGCCSGNNYVFPCNIHWVTLIAGPSCPQYMYIKLNQLYLERN